MITARRGILEGYPTILTLFLLLAFFSVWSWTSIRTDHPVHDPIHLGGLGFSIFITASIAYRSPLGADRFVFGAAAAAFSLAGIAMAPLDQTAIVIARASESLMWTVAAAGSFVVLLRSRR